MGCLIAYQNILDDATLSGGSWQTTLPLSNLQQRPLQRVARSTDASGNSTQFVMDFGRARTVGLVALLNHNASVDASWGVRLSDDAGFATVIYEWNDDVWSSLYNSLDLAWEDENFWSGKPTAESLAGYTWNAYHLLPTAQAGRYLEVTITDSGNADGYFQLGRVFVGAGWSPVIDLAPGASLGYETETTVQRSLAGAEYFERQEGYRVARFALRGLSKNEALIQALDMQRIAGTDGEVFFAWDTADRATIHSLRRTFLGRARKLSALEQPYQALFSTTFELQELR